MYTMNVLVSRTTYLRNFYVNVVYVKNKSKEKNLKINNIIRLYTHTTTT